MSVSMSQVNALRPVLLGCNTDLGKFRYSSRKGTQQSACPLEPHCTSVKASSHLVVSDNLCAQETSINRDIDLTHAHFGAGTGISM